MLLQLSEEAAGTMVRVVTHVPGQTDLKEFQVPYQKIHKSLAAAIIKKLQNKGALEAKDRTSHRDPDPARD